jgi:hypothetical protein
MTFCSIAIRAHSSSNRRCGSAFITTPWLRRPNKQLLRGNHEPTPKLSGVSLMFLLSHEKDATFCPTPLAADKLSHSFVL